MWDRPEALEAIAAVLSALALALLAAAALAVASRLPVFDLREVRVEGDLDRITRAQVEFIVRREVHGSLVSVDLAAVASAFEKLPWVRAVEVRRVWPPGLQVRVEEHVALARWGGVALVNTHGELFEGASDRVLPEFVGPAGSAAEIARRHAGFEQVLEPLGARVSQVTVSPRGAWQIRLDNGLSLALGREQIEERLSRFVAVYERSVATLGRKMSHVDLRYSNGFAVRVPGARIQGEATPRGNRGKAKAA